MHNTHNLYYARPDRYNNLLPEQGGVWQPLKEHLVNVAEIARLFASEISKDFVFIQNVYISGLLHDIGKYQPAFQKRLRDLVTMGKAHTAEHSGHGAAVLLDKHKTCSTFIIGGHHGGLPNKSDLISQTIRCKTVPETKPQECFEIAVQDVEQIKDYRNIIDLISDRNFVSDLNIRMMYSCLVDADRIDASGLTINSSMVKDSSFTKEQCEGFISEIHKYTSNKPVKNEELKKIRDSVLEKCIVAGDICCNMLSLSVPTGGGKTLASLAYALSRKMEDTTKRKIIVVTPFLSIIEQNAKDYRTILGTHNVLEHHSGDLVNEETEKDEDDHTKIPTGKENWNSPFIVTTAVRFFETLFNNKPKQLRRLHNIANSIIILDEIQILPRRLLAPILDMMKTLAKEWNVTFLLCTATQPSLETKEQTIYDKRLPIGTIHEIIEDRNSLYNSLSRVDIEWLCKDNNTTKFEDIATAMLENKQALCIVNLKKHSTLLYHIIMDKISTDLHNNVFHLSTAMCPAHRRNVIDSMKQLLAQKEHCYVVSTQCIETGVDIDFPMLYRVLCPFDSIVQAAGRCNRENSPNRGKIIVFVPQTEDGKICPPNAYEDATMISRNMLRENIVDINNPTVIREFFERYYRYNNQDEHNIQLYKSNLAFKNVSENFEMIDDNGWTVIVPYGNYKKLVHQLTVEPDNINIIRQLQEYQVSLKKDEFCKAKKENRVYTICDNNVYIVYESYYDKSIGIISTYLENSNNLKREHIATKNNDSVFIV